MPRQSFFEGTRHRTIEMNDPSYFNLDGALAGKSKGEPPCALL